MVCIYMYGVYVCIFIYVCIHVYMCVCNKVGPNILEVLYEEKNMTIFYKLYYVLNCFLLHFDMYLIRD